MFALVIKTKDGKEFDVKAEVLMRCSEEIIAVKQQQKWGLYNTAGDVVVPCKYDSIATFANGLIGLRLGTKQFLFDKTGKEVDEGSVFT